MFKPNQTSKTGWRLLSFVYYLTEEGISTAFSKTLSHIITYVPNILLPNWTNHKNLIRFGHFGILGCDIGQVLPKSTQIVHPVGIVIHKDADIGKNVKLLQNITIGNKQTTDDGVPEIQDNVVLCAGCSIIGDVTVGKNSVIGTNSTVISDIPPNAIAVGSPAEVIRSDTNHVRNKRN